MSLNWKDRAFVIFYLLLFSFSVYQLRQVNEFFKSGNIKIAKLTLMRGNVRGMGSKDLAWKKVIEGQELGPGDKLITSNQSSARIKFDNGAELELQPKTLTVLERQNIAIDQGEIKILKEPKTKNIFSKNSITVNGKEIVKNKKVKIKAKAIKPINKVEKLICNKKLDASFIVEKGMIKLQNAEKFKSILLYDRNKKMIQGLDVHNKFSITREIRDMVSYVSFTSQEGQCEYKTKLMLVELAPKFDIRKLKFMTFWSEGNVGYYFEPTGDYNEKSILPIIASFMDSAGNNIHRLERPVVGQKYYYNGEVNPKMLQISLLVKDLQEKIDIMLPKIDSPKMISVESLDKEMINLMKKFPQSISIRPLISWEKVQEAYGYQIEIFTKNENDFELIKTMRTNDTEIIFPLNFEPDIYYYKIKSLDKFSNPGEASRTMNLNWEKL